MRWWQGNESDRRIRKGMGALVRSRDHRERRALLGVEGVVTPEQTGHFNHTPANFDSAPSDVFVVM